MLSTKAINNSAIFCLNPATIKGFKITTLFKITAQATIYPKIQNDAFIYIK